MLKYKNKEGKLVMTENEQTGEVKVFDEKLKELKEIDTTEIIPAKEETDVEEEQN